MTFAWSFSQLSRFRNCPRQYYHLNVAKDFKEIEGDANKWGQRVHDAMAKRIVKSTPLPEGMEQWEKWAVHVLRDISPDPDGLFIERKMAVTRDEGRLKPCEFFDRHVEPWLRVVLDVLKIDEDMAFILDWKTGRRMDIDSLQLPISAAVVFAHYPNVEIIKTQYVWLAQDASKEETIERADLRKHWAQIAPQVERMVNSIRDRSWPAQPSGLCVKHCPVTTCEYYGKGNR